MQDLNLLWEYQELEKRKKKILTDCKKNGQTELLKKLKEEIESIQAEGKQKAGKINSLKKMLKEIEDEIFFEKERKQKLIDEIYANSLPVRELEAAQLNISAIEEKIKHNEEKALSLMEAIENEEKEISALLDDLNRKKDEFRQLNSQYQEKKNETNNELEKVKLKQEELFAMIDPQIFELYQKMCGNYEDRQGIARINNGTCTGCHMSLSFELLKKAKSEQVKCDRCGRFLFE